MKLNKQLIHVFSTCLFCLLLLGCNSNGKVKLGFLYSSSKTDRYVKETNFFKEKAQQLGADVIIMEANDDDALQYERALEMFDEGIDVLCLIAVNTNTAAAIVREAKSRDIKVIAYNRMIKSEELDLYISGDNKKLGEDMCASVLNVKPEGKYIILSGDKFDRNGVELDQSIQNVLEPSIQSGKIEIIYQTFVEDWNEYNAEFELNQVLSFSGEKPDVIIAAYDGIADGAIRALKKFDLAGDVLVTGQDAELRAIKNIISGKQLMTVYHPLKTLGHKAAELAFDLANNKTPDKSELSYVNNGIAEVPTIKIGSIPITKDNIQSVLIDGGVYSSDEVFN
jgi:D-xylose transport system substrate-binding protein